MCERAAPEDELAHTERQKERALYGRLGAGDTGDWQSSASTRTFT